VKQTNKNANDIIIPECKHNLDILHINEHYDLIKIFVLIKI